jgi:transposase InsO family protein
MGALIAVAEAECAVERGATVEEATRAIREQRFCGRPADAPPRPVMLSAAIAHAVDRATSDDVARKIRGTGALMLTHDGDRPADLVFGRDARIARLRWMARSPRDRGKAHGRDARETALLSPHRARPRPAEARDRRIVTDAQDVIWATDATQVAAVRDGKVWVFAVAGRRNAEALGWHGGTRGARRHALQAMRMTVRRQSGHPGRDAARGLARRHDHGSAFMAGDFPNRIRAWGAPPGHAVVGQPQTDGVIERFFRTCAEQVARGRIVQTIDEVRDAIRDVVACCDAEWLIEKNGHQSPDAMREKWNRETMPRVA